MSTWLPPTPDDDDIRAADELLDKADALLRRHKLADEATEKRPAAAPAASRPEPAASAATPVDDDDLPILTDVVDEDDFVTVSEAPSAFVPPPPLPDEAIEVAEALVRLDSEVSRAVESWFANELPQLLSRELDKLSDRLQEEAIAHLRATLLPTLSERISRTLETPLEEPLEDD